MSGAIPVSGDEEAEIGPHAIPVSLAQLLTKDVELGTKILFAGNSPREMLEASIQNRDWFRGAVVSATLLEHYGSLILQNKLHGKVASERLKNLTLEQIIVFLRALGVINQATYDKMLRIKDKRNDLTHEPFAELNPEDAESLVREAIECLDALGVADLPRNS